MTDIVKRLLRYEAERDPDVSIEAADEIERLRELNRQRYEEWETISRQLAESQAREAKLRELAKTLSKAISPKAVDAERWEKGVSPWYLNDIAVEVLALPHDDTALKAALKAERERCANICSRFDVCDPSYIADAIRALED